MKAYKNKAKINQRYHKSYICLLNIKINLIDIQNKLAY